MYRVVFLLLLAAPWLPSASAELPNGFVYLKEIDPTIKTDVRYASSNNFVGKKVDGYRARKIIITEKAAQALKQVQTNLRSEGLALKVFDAYRPRQAVNHFVRWARDRKDLRTKSKYYPDIDKSSLAGGGYISGRSRHSSGSTVDLTLMKDGVELDMGRPFDFFSEKSAHGSKIPTPKQQENRRRLKAAMEDGGFQPYNKEWWHYTLIGEPFAGRYFDFPVE